MGTCYKPTRIDEHGNRVRYRRYRLVWRDEHGDRRTKMAFKDKQASEALLAKLERDVERRKAGLPVVEEADRQRMLDEAVTEYVSELRRLGRSDVHCDNAVSSLRRAAFWCGWMRLSQVRIDGLTRYLAHRASMGLAPRTVNADRDYFCSFMDWCVRRHWATENPLRAIVKAPVGHKGRRRRRRAYTVTELQALLSCVPESRRLVYLVAATSGLRRNELRLVEWRDADLSHPGRPLWRFRGDVSKNGLAVTVPMTPECAEALKLLPRKSDRIFEKIPRIKTLHRDLSLAKLSRIDDSGRSLDFHSLRYFFCTQLARTLPVQKVRILMRHQTLRQTCDLYLDLGLDDVAEEVWSLPRLLPDEAKGNRGQVDRQPGVPGPLKETAQTEARRDQHAKDGRKHPPVSPS